LFRGFLTPLERRLAVWLPCTTAEVAVWYSRVWRGQEQRVQTLVWGVLIVAAGGALVWLTPPASSQSVRWTVSGGAQAWLGGLALLIGAWSGDALRRNVAARLDRHWLVWCLGQRQRRNETIVCGLWRGGVATLKLLLPCVLAMRWVALSAHDLLMLAALLFGGFMLAFALPHLRSRHASTLATPVPHARPSALSLPAIICLQAARPWGWLACAGVALLAVSMMAVMAVQTGAVYPLTAASVMASAGFMFMQTFLNPGAASLSGLLAWTGASLWWCLARVLALPAGLALILALPITIAALVLGRPLWAVAAALGVLAAAWYLLVRALGDLARMRRGRNEAFVFIHTLIPVALLMSLGPEESIALIGLHLGWLFWRGQRLWNAGPGSRRA